jgi:predicted ribosome quality control (RQC) complex YloA/Tae2 family protein
MIAEAEAEAARLADLAVFARLATVEADLRALRSTIHPERTQAQSKKPKRDKRRGPARFRHDGYTVLVGRNAQENEEVTFRLAGRDDVWLHVRERTGAHVAVQGGRGSVPPEVVESAARLAAYFSEARSESRVDVDVTAVRNVRKIPGGPPGRVTYRNFQTLRVEPGIEDWEPINP